MCGYPKSSARGGGNSQSKGPGVGTDCDRTTGRSVRGKQRVLDGRVVRDEGTWRSEVFGPVSQGKVFVFALLVQREV